ncbi:hypothetical protein OG873_17835 [Streptomyces violaceus]|uniref:Secreted protein n=1 Tax=Streptomyces violaceus TaxID=1936 RepID=A0ABZ1NUE6_STRVL
MKNSTIASGATVALLFSIVGPAQFAPSAFADSSPSVAAASKTIGCGSRGAKGNATIYDWGPGSPTGGEKKVTLKVKDTRTDGRRVGIRFYTKHSGADWKAWKWRYNKSGKGATKTWRTSVLDYQGVHGIKVRVATFDGKKLIKSCTDTVNPSG